MQKVSYKKNLTIFMIMVILSSVAVGQKLIAFDLSHGCSYFGEIIADQVYSFSSSTEAREVVNRILDTIGLSSNFEVMAANVPNAVALVQDSERLILYSENFISKIEISTGTDWASVSILAHEIGHHLNGHTLGLANNRPELELEADIFSGFTLARLGASLEEAQAAIETLNSTKESSTHPPKSARLEAIAIGWNKGVSQEPKGDTNYTEQQGITLESEKESNFATFSVENPFTRIELPSLFSGIYTFRGRAFDMHIEITDVYDNNFSGKLLWVNSSTLVLFEGGFEPIKDIIENARWKQVDEYILQGEKIFFKITQIVRGSGASGDGRYYGRIDPSGEIRGLVFRGEGTERIGTFIVQKSSD